MTHMTEQNGVAVLFWVVIGMAFGSGILFGIGMAALWGL